MICNEPLK